MISPKQAAAARRASDRAHRSLAEDLRRLRIDAGLTQSELARAAGVHPSQISRAEDAVTRPSIETYSKLAVALGADLSARFYPNTGPVIRDRHQAAILEALLGQLSPSWRPYPEVGVRHPARGWIDVVLHSDHARCVVATEIQSDLRRLEQQLRWFAAKSESLPSWEGWAHLGEITTRSALLIVRSTRSTRNVGAEFRQQLAAAYPAHPADAVVSLKAGRPWPGSALIWVEVRGNQVRFAERRR